MANVKELFPECMEYGYFSSPGYTAIVNSFGTVVLKSNVGSYQGTSFYILTDGERYGFLTFGWGSCSGCDALQGCSGYADLQAFYDRMKTWVTWKPNLDEFKIWFLNKDWQTEFSYHEEGWQEFFDKAVAALDVEHLRALR